MEDVYAIDKADANILLWNDEIREEMTKIKGSAKIHEGSYNELTGLQKITGHIIFGIKFGEEFRRKARFIDNGNKTKQSKLVTYSSIVSRDLVRITLMIAVWNESDIVGADIENAYLPAPYREKHC